MDLMRRFLDDADLSHLYGHLSEQGMELKFLLLANDNELKDMVTRIVDKIKLRNAIEKYRKDNSFDRPGTPPSDLGICSASTASSCLSAACNDVELPSLVDNSFDRPGTPPSDLGICSASAASSCSSAARNNVELVELPSFVDNSFDQPATPTSGLGLDRNSSLLEVQSPRSTPLLVIRDGSGGVQNSYAEWVEEEFQFVQEIGPLEDKKPLKELLLHTTFGKNLLLKQGLPLTPKDRKALVQLIVEHQLRILPSVKDTIRQEVWSSWANEICAVFTGENPEIYYVPYRVTERQALSASGLLHNRLISHRRVLKPGVSRKRDSDGHSTSSEKSNDSNSDSKRLRPLPIAVNTPSVEEDDTDIIIKWLESSSSPFDLVLQKWKASFKSRHDILKQRSIDEYFTQFPSLQLPTGHQLLAYDFENSYPLASAAFEENFPLIKVKLLELLVHKGSQLKAEPAVTDLLDLATVGEEQGSLAALRCIPYLLKQVAPVPTTIKGKKWKPARSEVSRAFITHVCSPADIERCVGERLSLTQEKGIPFGPYIIAVGASWSTITQYEVVVSQSVRFQFPNIKTALTTAFKIYFALDIEYTADAAPCWMFIQRAVYKIVTKFDFLYDKSVTLRELIKDCERTL